MAGEQDVTEGVLWWLRDRGDCVLRPGLAPAELDHAERVLGLTIAPGWRAVLLRAYPVARPGCATRYPEWRSPASAGTRDLVEAPVQGLLFDVAENGFWWHGWGPVPEAPETRLARARERLAEVPRLTPLGGHLYLAGDDDSPVFSVVQADLYVLALSLADLPRGRGQREVPERRYPIGAVPFWSELHAYGQYGHSGSRFGSLARGGL